jgi:hypothetical protein
MKIDSLIAASLGSLLGVGAVGCLGSVGDCEEPENVAPQPCDFDIDWNLTLDHVETLLERLAPSEFSEGSPSWTGSLDASTPCEVVCAALTVNCGNQTFEACEYTLDGIYAPSDMEDGVPSTTGAADDGGGMDWDGSKVVGSITCNGTGSYDPDGAPMPTCAGRRPLGHVEARRSRAQASHAHEADLACERSRALGSRLAQSAHLEAASVVAFVQLARQLKAWGAPDAFAQRCLSAARDEVLHARLMTTLAQAQGVAVPPVDAAAAHAATQTATLEMAALHNAVEGCVSETWAALQAHWQSRHAPGEAMRQVQARIAADETRHAQLAWDLHAWFLSRLDDAGAARVQHAQREALAQLPVRMTAGALVHAEAAIHDHDLRALGLPTPAQTHALATDYADRLAV